MSYLRKKRMTLTDPVEKMTVARKMKVQYNP